MSDKSKDSASIRAAIRDRILVIDRLRDAQALKRAEVHRRMQEIHDLALARREAGDRVPMPPVVPAPAGKWSWNGPDYVELWRIINGVASEEVVLADGTTLEGFIRQVAGMDAACNEISRETAQTHALADQLDRQEARRKTDEPIVPFDLSCEWDDRLQMIAISWAKAPGVEGVRFDVCQSAGDPYDAKIERIVGVDFASPGRLKPEFGPGVTMRFRVYGRASSGVVLRSNVVSVTRPLPQ